MYALLGHLSLLCACRFFARSLCLNHWFAHSGCARVLRFSSSTENQVKCCFCCCCCFFWRLLHWQTKTYGVYVSPFLFYHLCYSKKDTKCMKQEWIERGSDWERKRQSEWVNVYACAYCALGAHEMIYLFFYSCRRSVLCYLCFIVLTHRRVAAFFSRCLRRRCRRHRRLLIHFASSFCLSFLTFFVLF